MTRWPRVAGIVSWSISRPHAGMPLRTRTASSPAPSSAAASVTSAGRSPTFARRTSPPTPSRPAIGSAPAGSTPRTATPGTDSCSVTSAFVRSRKRCSRATTIRPGAGIDVELVGLGVDAVHTAPAVDLALRRQHERPRGVADPEGMHVLADLALEVVGGLAPGDGHHVALDRTHVHGHGHSLPPTPPLPSRVATVVFMGRLAHRLGSVASGRAPRPVPADLRRAQRPSGRRPVERRGRGDGLGRRLRVGPRRLQPARRRGGQPLGHDGRDGGGHRAGADRPDGDPAPPPSTPERRPGDDHARPAVERSNHPRRRHRQRQPPRAVGDRRGRRLAASAAPCSTRPSTS